MKHPRLIAISGIDCAGKSTQIELLVRAIRKTGRQSEVLWYRPGYSTRLDELRRVVRRRARGVLPPTGESKARDAAFRRPMVKYAWIAMAMLDTFAEYTARLRMLLHSGNTIVCDRYLLDARIDMNLRFPEHRRPLNAAFNILQGAAPQPCATILLHLPLDEMTRRASEKNEPFPDSPAMRATRHAEYETLATHPNIFVVDSTRSVETVHRAICRLVDVPAGCGDSPSR